jgi:uncharacterized cupredoxin-like copper-binding protein
MALLAAPAEGAWLSKTRGGAMSVFVDEPSVLAQQELGVEKGRTGGRPERPERPQPTRHHFLIDTVVVLALIAAAVAVFANRGASLSGSVQAIDTDNGIAVANPVVDAGRVKFTVTNNGTVEHELVVIRTDLPAGSLPETASGRVDEEGAGLTKLDPEAEDIAPGTSKSATLKLSAGRYVIVCNLPGHYANGMHAVVTAR